MNDNVVSPQPADGRGNSRSRGNGDPVRGRGSARRARSPCSGRGFGRPAQATVYVSVMGNETASEDRLSAAAARTCAGFLQARVADRRLQTRFTPVLSSSSMTVSRNQSRWPADRRSRRLGSGPRRRHSGAPSRLDPTRPAAPPKPSTSPIGSAFNPQEHAHGDTKQNAVPHQRPYPCSSAATSPRPIATRLGCRC